MANNVPIMGPIGFSKSPSTTQEFALGTTAQATDNGYWVYVKAGAAITQYDYATCDETYVMVTGTKAAVDVGHEILFPQVAFASGEYGWVPKCSMSMRVNVLALCAADVPLYTSATAGKLDDTSAGQTQIRGIVLTTTNGGSTASQPAIATAAQSNVIG